MLRQAGNCFIGYIILSRCDRVADCPWSEDERQCVALARAGELLLAGDGTPIDEEQVINWSLMFSCVNMLFSGNTGAVQ